MRDYPISPSILSPDDLSHFVECIGWSVLRRVTGAAFGTGGFSSMAEYLIEERYTGRDLPQVVEWLKHGDHAEGKKAFEMLQTW